MRVLWLGLKLLFAVAVGACATTPKAPPPPATGASLLVLNKAEASAWLVDLATGAARAKLATGEGPHEVAISADGRRAVVTDYGTRENPGKTLTVLDLEALARVETIDLGEHRRPHGIQWLPDGQRVVVTAEDSRALLVVDVEAKRVTQVIPTGEDVSHMVVVSPEGRHAYVTSIGSGALTMIDLEQGTKVRTVKTGAGAEGVDVTPDGREVWVTNRAADTLSVVSADTLEPLATVPSAAFPIRVKLTPDGRQALVSNARSSELRIFDTASRQQVAVIPMRFDQTLTQGRLFGDSFGGSAVPIGIVVSPDGRFAYVANANADAVTVVDLERRAITGYLPTGREPDGMGYVPAAQVSASASPPRR